LAILSCRLQLSRSSQTRQGLRHTFYPISTPDEASKVIRKAFAYPGPAFIHVLLDSETVVHPKLGVGKRIEDMSPHLDRDLLRNEMLIELLDD
jgi:acetolactate synthase-1/2/3 large subunit